MDVKEKTFFLLGPSSLTAAQEQAEQEGKRGAAAVEWIGLFA